MSGYNTDSNVFVQEVSMMSFSLTFWIVTLVLVLFLAGILTSSYNEDKTQGL